MAAAESDIERVEGRGVLNFLDLNDVPLAGEGEPVNPLSIISLPFGNGKSVFPTTQGGSSDVFLTRIHKMRDKMGHTRRSEQ
ncbi:hypothetical protein ACJ77P_00950 [Syntrophus buswellii]|jgi:hypothetical protein|uniref:hypothetical protein n=1 Tax=Syntrophus buswellii TaxID=43774 RepID=UPI0038D4BD23